MSKNGESIYGCGKADIPKPEYGRVTQKGNTYYIHVNENTIGPLPLIGVDKNRLVKIRALATGYEISVSTSWVHRDYPDMLFAELGGNPVLPDSMDYVLEVRVI